MLKAPADFPHAGSAAFLRGEPAEKPRPGMAWPVEAVRIIRWNQDQRALAEAASGNRTVPAARLFATAEEAMFPAPARRRKAA